MATPARMFAVILASVVAGCVPRVDAATAESCEESMRAVERADSAAVAPALAEVMMAGAGTAFGSAFSDAASLFSNDGLSVSRPLMDSTDMRVALCETLAGLSGPDIVAGADSLGAEFSLRLDEAADRRHLEALAQAKEAFDRVRDSLAGFDILSASVIQRAGFIGLEATITLTVRNSTNHAISKVALRGIVESPGRAVPWVDDEFNYQIRGGIEPGEETTWRLQPNFMQDAWTATKIPPEAVMRAEVIGLEGADGEPLWGGPKFTKGDQALLDSLRARFSSP